MSNWMIRSTPQDWDRRADPRQPDHVIADCGSIASHERRLRALLDLPLAPGEQVVDLGCGTGRLGDLLPPGTTYLGIDWSPEVVAVAKNRRTYLSFTVGGVEDLPPADWIVASGPFNYSEGWSTRQTRDAMRGMWSKANRGIGITVRRTAEPGRLHYTEEVLLGYMADLDWRRLEFDRSYLPNDLCVRVWRKH
jgi:SAM-dependent methyltransferase